MNYNTHCITRQLLGCTGASDKLLLLQLPEWMQGARAATRSHTVVPAVCPFSKVTL